MAKFFDGEARVAELLAATDAAPGDLIFFAADTEPNVSKYLGWLRSAIADRRGLIPENAWKFCWVVDFPLFGWDAETKAVYSMHHPFTSPKDEDLHLLRIDPPNPLRQAGNAPHDEQLPLTEDVLKVRAKAYDVVLNGIELGGGSIRIHRQDVQSKIFRILGLTPDEAKAKFEFLLDALRYGAPPHGGIALGLDRIVMLFGGYDSIRDVIAFPKNARAICPLTDAPSPVTPKQLQELGLRLQ